MNRMDDSLKVLADLEPARLDQIAEQAWARNRAGDLARAAADSLPYPAPRRGPRHLPARSARPILLAGGISVAAAAAVAAVALAGGTPAIKPGPPSADQGTARSFLLASAQIARTAPPATGAYWYTRERAAEPTDPLSKSRKVFLRGISYVATSENWAGQTGGRSIVDEKLSFKFASTAARAKWRAMGKPALATAAGTDTAPATSSYQMAFRWGPGRGLTMARFQRLPTTPAALRSYLERSWNRAPDQAAVSGSPRPSFSNYLFQWADAVLTGPATPGTRAAMYQLLAQRPGMKIISPVTDPLGRAAVAVTDGRGDYLVIDPKTARELAYTSNPVHANSAIAMSSGTEVWEAMGWTGKIGLRPQS